MDGEENWSSYSAPSHCYYCIYRAICIKFDKTCIYIYKYIYDLYEISRGNVEHSERFVTQVCDEGHIGQFHKYKINLALTCYLSFSIFKNYKRIVD